MKARKRTHIYALVDTGAVCNVLSLQCYDALPNRCKTALKPSQLKLSNADGRALKLVGQSTVFLSAEGYDFDIEVQVADDLGNLPMILGMQFLSTHGMSMNIVD